jgi:ABC-type taurine transport system ATPase subunit
MSEISSDESGRVALARAVYVRSKFVLLDDPLSAVVSLGYLMDFPKFIVCQFQDSHTARLLFDKLLRGPLLAHRTVVSRDALVRVL